MEGEIWKSLWIWKCGCKFVERFMKMNWWKTCLYGEWLNKWFMFEVDMIMRFYHFYWEIGTRRIFVERYMFLKVPHQTQFHDHIDNRENSEGRFDVWTRVCGLCREISSSLRSFFGSISSSQNDDIWISWYAWGIWGYDAFVNLVMFCLFRLLLGCNFGSNVWSLWQEDTESTQAYLNTSFLLITIDEMCIFRIFLNPLKDIFKSPFVFIGFKQIKDKSIRLYYSQKGHS